MTKFLLLNKALNIKLNVEAETEEKAVQLAKMHLDYCINKGIYTLLDKVN
jgi:hypothetical protein